MAVLDGYALEALHIVARELQQRAEQTATVATDSATPTATAQPTPTPSNSGNSNNGTQSPLLFFVALGFGVVFTNLWIIVGVKYCFRYNARNRALARGEDGEPITLEAMPRPHRRRREKKLMTMDEVNERFPMTKYKTWTISRARDGLPTAGGVAAPASSPAIVRDAEGVLPASPTDTKHTVDRPVTAKSEGAPEITVSSPTNPMGGQFEGRKSVDESEKSKDDTSQPMPTLKEVETNATVDPKDPNTHHEEDEDDDDDDHHIHTALGPDVLDHPGDSCAICIDTLEDDDDIRGLTCGHAFHAGCLDPWLTSRRACCPLCKADYFTPKARAEGEVPEPERPSRRTRLNMPQQPRTAWTGLRGHPRILLPGRMLASPAYANDPYGYPQQIPSWRERRRVARDAQQRETQQSGGVSAFTQRLNPFNWNRGNAPAAVGTEMTPAQLETGVVR